MVGGFAARAFQFMTSPVERSLERLVYRSDVTGAAEGPMDLSAIVATSVRNNGRQRVTGALSQQSGTFVQVLEGDALTLTALMDAIGADTRHRNVRVLARWPVQAQLFLGWAMVLLDTRKLSPHLSRLLSQTGSGSQVTGVLVGLANARLGSMV